MKTLSHVAEIAVRLDCVSICAMSDGSRSLLIPEVEAYLERVRPPGDTVLRALAAARETGESQPSVGLDFAQLVEGLICCGNFTQALLIEPRSGWEIAVSLRAASELSVRAVVKNDQITVAAGQTLDACGLSKERVEFTVGEPMRELMRLEESFDLVQICGDPTTYRRGLDLALQRLRVGGVVLVPGMLGVGNSAVYGDEEGEVSEQLRSFAPYFLIHPQLVSTLLPVEYGVGLGFKRKRLTTELGGPF